MTKGLKTLQTVLSNTTKNALFVKSDTGTNNCPVLFQNSLTINQELEYAAGYDVFTGAFQMTNTILPDTIYEYSDSFDLTGLAFTGGSYQIVKIDYKIGCFNEEKVYARYSEPVKMPEFITLETVANETIIDFNFP